MINGFFSIKGRSLVVNITIILLCIGACGPTEPIKVGFLAGLTGRVADLGIAGRDGAILAVEQTNREGGFMADPSNS